MAGDVLAPWRAPGAVFLQGKPADQPHRIGVERVYLQFLVDLGPAPPRWATCRVLSWRLSIMMEAAFCVETLEDTLTRHGKPEMFNTDQGSQFTGAAITGALGR